MTKTSSKQKNHHANNRVIKKSIGVEYFYLDQLRNQIDVKNIAK
jgi:hypothetical protein